MCSSIILFYVFSVISLPSHIHSANTPFKNARGLRNNESCQADLTDFISKMVPYTKSNTVALIFDNTTDHKMQHKLVRKLSLDAWLLVFTSGDQFMDALKYFSRPTMATFLSLDAFTKVINKVHESSETLNIISWLVVVKRRIWPEDLNLKIVTPALRLFFAHAHRQTVNDSSNESVFVSQVSYIYHDYVTNSHKVVYLGHHCETAGLTLWKKFEECCYDLTGYKVNVVYVKDENVFVTVHHTDSGIVLRGVCGEIFMNIANILGINVSFYPVPDGKFGDYNEKTGKVTGLFHELFTHKADIAVSGLTETVPRRKVSIFSETVIDTYVTAIYFRIKNSEYLYLYLNPFHRWTWIAVSLMGLILLTVGIIFQMICVLDDCEWNLINVWGALTNQETGLRLRFDGLRIFKYTIFVTAQLLTCFYGSQLLSQAAVKTEAEPFTNFHELAHHNHYRPFLLSHTSTLYDVLNSNYSEYAAIGKRIREEPEKYVKDVVFNDIPEILRDRQSVYIGDIDILLHLQKQDRSLSIMDKRYFQSGLHFAYRKDLPISRMINRAIVKMREGGTLDQIRKKYSRKIAIPPSVHKPEQISFNHIRALVAIISIGILSSIVLLAKNIVCRAFKRV